MFASASHKCSGNPVLAALRRDLGADGFEGAVVAFADETAALLDAIENRAAARDERGLHRVTHRLSGVLLQYGFTAAANVACLVEDAPREWPVDPALFAKLRYIVHEATVVAEEARGSPI